jgi:hypothetical protein
MNQKEFDVIIVGAGPFSCFCAVLLSQQSLRVGLIYPHNTQPMESFLHSVNACWPSLNDPPTRAHAAHGHQVALYLQEFCNKGAMFFYNSILPLIEDSSNWLAAECYRVGLKEFEVEELHQASALGFGLEKTNKNNIFKEIYSSYICLDKKLFQKKIIQFLQKNNVTFLQSEVINISETQNNCNLTLANGQQTNSEIIILGNSLNISKLLSRYNSILVPMSDCLYNYEAVLPKTNVKFPFSYRMSNGHISLVAYSILEKIFIKITGPRFLLPGAGAGVNLENVSIEEKIFNNIEKYHKDIIFKFLLEDLNIDVKNNFNYEKSIKCVDKRILADCYPCDELPMLGEFGKLGRILGNTGWLATGFSAGAWAAHIICDLVLHEKSADLHSRLQPRRFFSSFIKSNVI